MLIIITQSGLIENTEVNMSRDELVEMLADGCFNRDPVAKIIHMSSGLLGADITAAVAEQVWQGYNADDRMPHHDLEQWLLTFGHHCDGFGETNDQMIAWPQHRD